MSDEIHIVVEDDPEIILVEVAEQGEPGPPGPPGPVGGSWGTITGTLSMQVDLQAALDGKSNVGHTHSWDSITGRPLTFAPSAHGHVIADVTGLQTALDGKAPASGIPPSAITGTAVVTTDPRLSDARPPTSHTHPFADVTAAGTTETFSFGDTDQLAFWQGGTEPRRGLLSALWTWLLFKFSSSPLAVNSGGTGANSASAARVNLGGGTTGIALFQAATPAAACAAIGTLTNLAISGGSNNMLRVPVTYTNDSDFATTSTSFVDVTGLSFPVLANKKYAIIAYLLTNKNDTSGMRIRWEGPASPTKLSLRSFHSASNFSGTALDHFTAFSVESTTFNTFNGDGMSQINFGLISNGANAGIVKLQLRAITGGTARIYAGSWIQVAQLD